MHNPTNTIDHPPAATPAFRVLSRADAPGAIGLVEVVGQADAVFSRLGLGELPIGGVVVADLAGVDRGVVVRWTDARLHLMPHGGVQVMRALRAALLNLQFTESDSDFEHRDVEAAALHAVARAASSLAIDLLLDQPARWRSVAAITPEIESRSRCLNRLIDPPLVVAIGPPNIGKSSLVNALAGRSVSVVADEPGTTRDHVGVWLDMAGMVVRYLDTPGVRAGGDEIESAAIEAAGLAAAGADLLVVCSDSTAPPPRIPAHNAEVLRVELRADLGRSGAPVDVRVSSRTGEGLATLVQAVRERLVPTSVLADPGPWKFWSEPGVPGR